MSGMGFCWSLSCGFSQQVYYKSPFTSHLVQRHFGEGIVAEACPLIGQQLVDQLPWEHNVR
jgi:hypothetical protein